MHFENVSNSSRVRRVNKGPNNETTNSVPRTHSFFRNRVRSVALALMRFNAPDLSKALSRSANLPNARPLSNRSRANLLTFLLIGLSNNRLSSCASNKIHSQDQQFCTLSRSPACLGCHMAKNPHPPGPSAEDTARRLVVLKYVVVYALTTPPRGMLRMLLQKWSADERQKFTADGEAKRDVVWQPLHQTGLWQYV